MAGFYNPYMRGLDWAGGLGDIANRLMMMQLLGMFPSKKTTTTKTELPSARDFSDISSQAPSMMFNEPYQGSYSPTGSATGMSNITGGLGSMALGLTPDQIKQIMELLNVGGIGGGF